MALRPTIKGVGVAWFNTRSDILVYFSVIIPAFNVRGYLRQAVTSVAYSDDAEVIIVDDHSTDGTGSLADTLARDFDNVQVIRPDRNRGLGEARNLGMRYATGDYILFLDGDDYFTPGALDMIRSRCVETSADVVLFGYERVFANGAREEGKIRDVLQIPGTFDAQSYPRVFDILNVAWNKAYRREFVEASGVAFPVGYYEDIPWSYPLLARAQSIACIDAPLYAYRQRWAGSILRSTDARHLEIVDQFVLFARDLATLDLDDAARHAAFSAAFRNLATLVTSQRGRIPKRLRSKFYSRARAGVREHAPRGYLPPSDGWKARQMKWMWNVRSYAAFRARERALGGLRKVRNAVTALPRKLYHHRLNYVGMRRWAPLRSDLVVFESLWGRSPRLNCAAVEAEIQRAHPELHTVWLVLPREVPRLPAGTDYAVHGSRKYYDALARARFVFLDGNPPSWWRKRRGQTLTQLHHGTPLKYMGIEERGRSPEWRDGLLQRCSQWDFSVVANSYSTEVWKHSYPINCETLELGYPRNDLLVNATAADVGAARAMVGAEDHARVILYAPTWRERGEFSAGSGVEAIANALEPDDLLLVRGHYYEAFGRRSEWPDNIRDVSDFPHVESLMLAADVLITDYSSVMFDFANLRKPIVIYAYDWAAYAAQRGVYFDITVDAPGPVAETIDEIAVVLRDRTYRETAHVERLARFAAIFTEFETGTASRDVVARVVDGVHITREVSQPVPAIASWTVGRSG